MSTAAKQGTDPKSPVNAAKGNLQGQTTLAAKIDRWQHMNTNVQAQLQEFPQLKDFQAKFQQIIADANALRSEMMVIEASALDATVRRNALIRAGDDLFSRLGHGLKSALGSKSALLAKYGLKRGKPGPKAKPGQPTPPPDSTPPPVAAQESPAAPSSAEK